MYRLSVFVVVIVVLMVTACSKADQVDMNLVTAYSDVLVVRFALADSADVVRAYDSVARAHGYEPDQMRSEIRSLASSHQLMRAFYDSVSVRLDSLKKSAIEAESR